METKKKKKRLSILDYLLLFVENLKLIAIFIIFFLLFAFLQTLFLPNLFISDANLIAKNEGRISTELNPTDTRIEYDNEVGPNYTNQVSGNEMVRMSGHPSHIFNRLIASKDFLLLLSKQKYYFEDIDTSISFIDYTRLKKGMITKGDRIKKYTVYLPYTFLYWMRGDKSSTSTDGRKNKYLFYEFDRYQEKTINYLSQTVRITVNQPEDQDYQSIIITVESFDKYLSSQLCTKTIEILKEELRKISTQKIKNNLNYVKYKFLETAKDLNRAEQNLAKFMDSNLDPFDARLKIEVERLRRKVGFKATLYEDLQTQLTQVEINLKKNEPHFSIIEKPRVGYKKEHQVGQLYRRYFLIGLGLAILILLIRKNFHYVSDDPDNAEKLEQIKDALRKQHLYLKKKLNGNKKNNKKRV